MPELPEVEVVRAGLARQVLGRTIAAVQVTHPRAIRRHLGGAADFADRLTGATLLEACRRGKYLWLTLDGSPDPAGAALLGHLGMSGQFLVQPSTADPHKHRHVRLQFADRGPELWFVDQRTFGGLCVESLVDGGGDPVPASVAHIARDPMDPAFDSAGFVRGLRRRRTQLKRALLDQTLISGIGNIYADEALWAAELHYARPTETIRRAQAHRLVETVRTVMAAALAAGGTSFDSLYVDVNGSSGYFSRSLEVYGRAGLACSRCAGPIRREPFMNRSSWFCPRCQQPPAGGPRRA